jgi:hypothetical protein
MILLLPRFHRSVSLQGVTKVLAVFLKLFPKHVLKVSISLQKRF